MYVCFVCLCVRVSESLCIYPLSLNTFPKIFFSLFLSVFIHFCLFLSISVCSCLFLSVSFCFCPFLSVYVCVSLFLSVYFLLGLFLSISAHIKRFSVSRKPDFFGILLLLCLLLHQFSLTSS